MESEHAYDFECKADYARLINYQGSPAGSFKEAFSPAGKLQLRGCEPALEPKQLGLARSDPDWEERNMSYRTRTSPDNVAWR